MTDIRDKYKAYKQLRENRLEMERAAKALKQQESELRSDILDSLPLDGAVVDGRTLQPKLKPRPFIKDYEALREFIVDTGYIEVFNLAINAKAIRDIGDVPGIDFYYYTEMSDTKAS